MGIKHLNNYLVNKCSHRAIRGVSLQALRGKTVVFDAFIYLYKYLTEECLLERFQQLMYVMQMHQIEVIFVFDGRPPEDKQALVAQRRSHKEATWRTYQALKETGTADQTVLKELKKRSVRVNPEHVRSVKTLLYSYGATVIDAVAEADAICVDMVKCRRAWACVSDDMDMFVYGCPRVLRNLCLDSETVTLYTMEAILRELHMTLEQFREIAVLSGTDYNMDNSVCLFHIIHWFREFKRTGADRRETFYQWLQTHTECIRDYDKLVKVKQMFSSTNVAVPDRPCGARKYDLGSGRESSSVSWR